MFTSDDPPTKPFVFGTPYGPNVPNGIDPHNADATRSFNVIDQVCEGLFAYNLTNPENEVIPNLATGNGTWSGDDLNYTVSLRTGVSFHDGTAFNATAVNFTFSRLLYFFENGLSNIKSLYAFSDGTIILNRTEIVDTDTIKFVLNRPFGAFQALLCFSGSYILSPTSTPATTLIDTATGDLVGTGPFVYDTYNVGTNVTFHAFENYWRGKASIEEMVFKIISDDTDRNNALLAEEIHFLSDPLPENYDNIKSDPDLAFLNQSKTGAETNYLGMNNKQINTTIREAISYAINYTYIIDELMEGRAERLKSPLPLGIRYANLTFDFPILNLSYARKVMQDMEFGVGFTDDGEWETATFLTYNYSYNIDNQFQGDLFVLLHDNLSKIGINVVDAGMTYLELINRLYETGDRHRNMLQLFWMTWMPDYNDPHNTINRLFTNRTSADNFAQYDGYEAAKEAGRNHSAWINNVQLLIEAGISETNQTNREAIYYRIQELLIEDDRPLAWGFVEKLYDASHVALSGFQQNAFKKLNFYSCQWNYYNYSMEITHPQDINYIEGSVGNTITWNITAKEMYNTIYSIYIDDILNQTKSWEVGVPIVVNIDNLSVNAYNYRIEAQNGNEEIEDTVYVVVNPLTVQISHPDDVSYINGSTGNSITWNILTNLELNTICYVYQNDSLFDTRGWQSGSPVIVNIDNFTEGSYEFCIEAHSGSTIEDDIVIVTVIPNDPIIPDYPIIPDDSIILIPGFDVFIVFFTVIIGIGFISWQAKRKLKKY